jgi:hypothetical protein
LAIIAELSFDQARFGVGSSRLLQLNQLPGCLICRHLTLVGRRRRIVVMSESAPNLIAILNFDRIPAANLIWHRLPNVGHKRNAG